MLCLPVQGENLVAWMRVSHTHESNQARCLSRDHESFVGGHDPDLDATTRRVNRQDLIPRGLLVEQRIHRHAEPGRHRT